jgi:hypothetical protein
MSQTNAIASINSLLLQLPEALQIEALHYVEYLKQRIATNEVDQPFDRETDPIVLMQLPLTDRRQVLAAQAAVIADHYEQDNDWQAFGADPVAPVTTPKQSAEAILAATRGSWGNQSIDEIDAELARQRQFDWGE